MIYYNLEFVYLPHFHHYSVSFSVILVALRMAFFISGINGQPQVSVSVALAWQLLETVFVGLRQALVVVIVTFSIFLDVIDFTHPLPWVVVKI